MKPRNTGEAEAMTLDCVCGRTSGVLLRHYQRYQCQCARWFWALRPKNGGPLALHPWPGDAMEDKVIQQALRAETYPYDYP